METELDGLNSKDGVPLGHGNPNFERVSVLVQIVKPREAVDVDPVAGDNRARARPGGALDRVAKRELELRGVRNH